MQDQLYRLNVETLGIISMPDQRRMTVMIPKGATITVVNGYINGSRMVDVLWDGDIVMIFVEDLRARGIVIGPAPLKSAKAKSKGNGVSTLNL